MKVTNQFLFYNSWNKDQICINTTKSNKAKISNTVSPRPSFFQWLSLKQELCSALNPNSTQCFSNLFLTHPILRTILHCNKDPIFLHTYVCTVCIYVMKQKSQKIILFLISYNFIFSLYFSPNASHPLNSFQD